MCSFSFFFTAPVPTELYTLSLHDALPISSSAIAPVPGSVRRWPAATGGADHGCGGVAAPTSPDPEGAASNRPGWRSEEHTSELQSRVDLVCRLLLEKKKKKRTTNKMHKRR